MHIEQHIYCRNMDDMLGFYTEELGLFILAQDYGMGSCKMVSRLHPACALLVSRVDDHHPSSRPGFSIVVDDLDHLHQKYRSTEFRSGGFLASVSGIFEYPAERTITMVDPARNIFLICQRS